MQTGNSHLQVWTGRMSKGGLCFGEAFNSVVKDHANWHRQVPFWLGLQTDTGVRMS